MAIRARDFGSDLIAQAEKGRRLPGPQLCSLRCPHERHNGCLGMTQSEAGARREAGLWPWT